MAIGQAKVNVTFLFSFCDSVVLRRLLLMGLNERIVLHTSICSVNQLVVNVCTEGN